MDIPPSLKSVAPYLRLAKQFEQRDLVVAYFCQLYFVQNGIKLAGKTDDGKRFLLGVMDQIEERKAALVAQDEEAVSNEVVASAHIESKALQLFLFADKEDRNGNFDTKVIKAFYTSSLLFELLTTFGELNEEVAYQKRYAQWKATYLEKCRRSGEVPQPGPANFDQEEEEADQPGSSQDQNPYQQPSQPSYPSDEPAYPSQQTYQPPTQPTYQPPSQPTYQPPTQPTYQPPTQPTYQPPAPAPVAQPAYQPPAQPSYNQPSTPTFSGQLLDLNLNEFQQLGPSEIERLQKLCRFAGSALNYQDFKTTLDNLQRAINLIRCGREQ